MIVMADYADSDINTDADNGAGVGDRVCAQNPKEGLTII